MLKIILLIFFNIKILIMANYLKLLQNKNIINFILYLINNKDKNMTLTLKMTQLICLKARNYLELII